MATRQTRCPDGSYEIGPHPIRRLTPVGDVTSDNVRGKAGRHLPALSRQPQRRSGVDGHGQQRFRVTQPELRHAEGHHVRETDGRRGARVEVAGQRDGGARVDEPPRGSLPWLSEKRHRRGEEHRHGVAPGERADAGLRDARQVVGAHRAQLGRELGPARPFELVGVELEAQPGGPGRGQDGARLGNAEDARLAEHVAKPREALAGDRGDHLLTQQAHVVPTPGAVLGRHLVGAEKRGDEPRSRLGGQPADDAQLLALRLEVEPVARLDLDGRRPVRQEHGEPRAGDGGQLLLRVGAHVPHRLQDAAARGRDDLVALAERATLVVVEAGGAEDGMRMAVDEAGVEHTGDLDLLECSVCSTELAKGAHRHDPSAVHQHGRIAEDFQLRQLAAATGARRAAARDDRARAGEQGAQSLVSCIGRRRPWRRAVSSASG